MAQSSNTPGSVGTDNRVLTARSVLASWLLGTESSRLPVSELVRLSGVFGINENRARVALSRMVAAGEATTDGAGMYCLAGHLLRRQQRQSESRRGATRTWNGRWHLVSVITSGSSAEVRNERRAALTFARLSELREGLWLRPDNIELDLDGDVRADLSLFSAEPLNDPGGLVHQLWDLGAWADRARQLMMDMERCEPRSGEDLAPGFVVSAAILRHFQSDPLLPPELAPPRWPGSDLRSRYDEWDDRYRQVLARWRQSETK